MILDLRILDIYLQGKVLSFAGNWSYLIQRYDAADLPKISYQEDYVHKSASMIKVLILAALCDSDIDLAEKIRIDAVPRVEGGGALQEMNGDAQLTMQALASLMIVLSDNLATNLLIDRLGRENIQAYADKLGLKQTKLKRCMMDFTAAQNGRENYMSVADYNKLLHYIYTKREELRFAKAWEILARQQFRDRIPYYWDEDIVFHHKTGMLDGVEHDGGVFEGRNGTYGITIFASDLPSNALGGRQIGELGRFIFDFLNARQRRS